MASGEWALSTALLFRPNVYFKPFDSCGEHIGWAPGPRMLLAGFSFHYFPICKVGKIAVMAGYGDRRLRQNSCSLNTVNSL